MQFFNCINQADVIVGTSLSPQARDDDRNGNIESARSKGRLALGLNIGAIVGWVAVITVVSVAVGIRVNAYRRPY